MPYPASAKQKSPATMPYEEIKLTAIEGTHFGIRHILHLPGGQRFIGCSYFGSSRVWDLGTGAQVGEEWEDKEEVEAIALSPDGKTLASGSEDGAVILWNIDTGKVIKKWAGHTKPEVNSVCWSSDGGRVVSGSRDGTFIVWDVESGRIILGPIKAGGFIRAVCYSPDAKMIATAGDSGMKVWDANTGELLKTPSERFCSCLVWTSDGKTLIAAEGNVIRKFDTATWSALELQVDDFILSIVLSPNERILASTSYFNKTAQLWNLETNQPIKPPLHHEGHVRCAAFSADGMFLIVGCSKYDDPVYKWDLSVIVKDASLLSNNVDATRRPTPKIKVAPRRRIPPGFFDDARHADLFTSHTQSHGQHNSRTLSGFPSFWRRRPFNRHGAPERGTQPWRSPFSWTRNLVSGMVRRRDGSDVELQEPPIIEVPCTAGQPRNYHARRKKPAASSSQRAHAHPARQPPPTSTASTPPIATASIHHTVPDAAGATGTITHPHIPITGWRARLLAWVCCIPIQNTN